MPNLAKLIDIEIKQGAAGLYHATSPQLNGLFVSGESEQELLEAAPVLIEALYSEQGRKVVVLATDNSNPKIPSPWVVVESSQLQHTAD